VGYLKATWVVWMGGVTLGHHWLLQYTTIAKLLIYSFL